MLIASSEPGSQTTKTGLPIVHSGTVRVSSPFTNSQVFTSFRFFSKDVEVIAHIVRGDNNANTQEMEEQRHRPGNRRLKIRTHPSALGLVPRGPTKEHRHTRLRHYQGPEWVADCDSTASDISGRGHNEDTYKGFYNDVKCNRYPKKKMQKMLPILVGFAKFCLMVIRLVPARFGVES